MITDYEIATKASHYFYDERNAQNKFWLIQTIESQLKRDFFEREDIKKALKEQLKLVETHKTTPFAAAEYLLSL